MPKRKSEHNDDVEQSTKVQRLGNLEHPVGHLQGNADGVIRLANSLSDDDFKHRYMLQPGRNELRYQPPDAGRTLDISIKSGATLTTTELSACLGIREQCLDTSSSKTELKSLRDALKTNSSRFLLVRPYTPMGTNTPVAYVKLELGGIDLKPVLLIHDLYLAKSVRKMGLAAFLLRTVEDMATRVPVRMMFSSYSTSNRFARPIFVQADFHTVAATSDASTVSVVKHVEVSQTPTKALQDMNPNARKKLAGSLPHDEESERAASQRKAPQKMSFEFKIGFRGTGEARNPGTSYGTSTPQASIDECLAKVRQILMRETKDFAGHCRTLDCWDDKPE